MRNLIIKGFALTATFALVLALSGSFSATGTAANVLHDEFTCGISLGPIGGGGISTSDVHSTVTGNGNTIFKCTGEIPEALLPASAVIVNGLGCSTYAGFTNNVTNLYTPSGKAQLICQVNGSN
jgi:hypothetical protein